MPSGLEVGALAIDLTLAVASASLLWRDRGAALRATWRAGGRAEHAFWGLLAAWLALSVVQIPFSPRVVDAVQGLRLTQAYSLLVLAGIALVPVARGRDWVRGLLWVLTPIAAYAAFRAAVDPPTWVTDYAYERTPMNQFGELLRDVGSFSSVVALASFLTPVAVFSLVLGALRPRYRLHAWVVFALSAVAGHRLLCAHRHRGGGRRRRGARPSAPRQPRGVRPREARRRPDRRRRGRRDVRGGGPRRRCLLEHGGAGQGPQRPARRPVAEDPVEDMEPVGGQDPPPSHWGPGSGPSVTRLRRDAGSRFTDNTYLKVFQEQGVLGGLLFTLGLFGTAVLVGRRLARGRPTDDPVAIAALAAFVSFLVLCVLGEYIEQAGKGVAWTLLGVALWGAYGAPSWTPAATPAG